MQEQDVVEDWAAVCQHNSDDVHNGLGYIHGIDHKYQDQRSTKLGHRGVDETTAASKSCDAVTTAGWRDSFYPSLLSLVIFAPNKFLQHCVRFYQCMQKRRIMCAWHRWTYGMAGAIAHLYTYFIQLISTTQLQFRRTPVDLLSIRPLSRVWLLRNGPLFDTVR